MAAAPMDGSSKHQRYQRERHDAPLREAASRGDAAKVGAELAQGANALAVNKEGYSALMLAARVASPECVALLLPVSDPLRALPLQGVGAQRCGGLTPLMLAVDALNWEDQVELAMACVRQLLPVSDPLAREERGRTALMLACGHGSEACVDLLLPRSDPRQVDEEGHSALAYAVMRREGVACVEAMMRALGPADIHAKSGSGYSPMEIAQASNPKARRFFESALAQEEARELGSVLVAAAVQSRKPGI